MSSAVKDLKELHEHPSGVRIGSDDGSRKGIRSRRLW